MIRNEDTTVNIDQPHRINIPLFLHQLKSIEMMEKMEKEKMVDLTSSIYINTRLGVLADLPGYGKSLSMLGLIDRTLDYLPPDTFPLERTTNFKYVSLTKVDILQQVNCTLILVNISLLNQWIQELNRTLLRHTAIYSKNDIEEIDISQYDVILVANNIYNLFSQVYRKKSWKRFVIDEPASLKLPAMEESHAQFYWLITSTPHELYIKRRTGFLNDLLPDDGEIFEHLIIKNDDHFVKSSYVMPITKHYHYKCSGNMASLFEGIVSETVLEMIQAGNIAGVFHYLECDGNEYPTIIEAFKARKSKRLYELLKERDYRDEEKNEKNEKTLEKIETIQSHLAMLDQKIFKYVLEKPCIICNQTQQTSKPSILSCCQNIYCGTCIDEKETTCPLCKSSEMIKIPLKMEEAKEEIHVMTNTMNVMNKTKINTILDLIGTTENKKILIFSNYNESFTVLKRFLDEKNLSYLELRGTKEKRDNTIDLYKTGNVNILLLNTIHSGAGLNLQETTDIILYHRVHEYQKIQVIGRANRIGRKIQLNVHYLE